MNKKFPQYYHAIKETTSDPDESVCHQQGFFDYSTQLIFT